MAAPKLPTKLKDHVRSFFGDLGPGLITGAADDDPSGISTYSIAGAAFGYAQLWTVLFSFPMMAGVQIMCARLGIVTGRGFAANLRRRYSPWVLWLACSMLAVANIVNIGADLAGMGESLQMLTGVDARLWMPIFAAVIIGSLVFFSYRRMAQIFKWLTLALFAYVFAAFLAKPDWGAVLKATFVPEFEWGPEYIATFVAILGTTISPYLFFWQAAQEVEEEKEHHLKTAEARCGPQNANLKAANIDVMVGMGFSNVVMYFIIVTTGATLHKHGLTNIETARQAAEALRPLAGQLAYLLFAIGIVGTGMLGVPVLAGSAAYAIAEAKHWRGSLNDRPHVGKKFYWVVVGAVVVGLILNFANVSAVRALFWAAIVNGVLAPPLVLMMTMLTSDRQVMGSRTSPKLIKGIGYFTALVMASAAALMFATLRA